MGMTTIWFFKKIQIYILHNSMMKIDYFLSVLDPVSCKFAAVLSL